MESAMEHRQVGRSGLRVSRLGLGTMTWGRDTEEDDAAAQLKDFVDAGGTLVDTADVYGDGASETVLGRSLGSVVPRDAVVVATKAFGRTGPGPLGRGASRGHLLAALDASLRRLGLDTVDLWQLHGWDDEVPFDETLAALDTAVASGRARYVGVSNYTGWQLGCAVSWQRAWPGRVPVVSTQVEYSLLQRGIEREVLPGARQLGVGVIGWSPLGRGVLTGKYRTGTPADSRAASPQWERFITPYLGERGRGIVGAVLTAAEGLGVSPLEVALAWARDAPGISAVLVGARTAAQLRGSLAAEEVELPEEIRGALDDVSEPSWGYPERWPSA
jgi:aryl-alcohol dehydrogenase-like predicted oxidoreductase